MSNFTLGSIFSVEIVLMKKNKINEFIVSQDSYVKYKFNF